MGAEHSSENNPSELLAKIDAASGSADAEVERLFALLDKDKSGQLEGAEYKQFMELASDYLEKDLAKAGIKRDKISLSLVLTKWLDPNHDGKISLAEIKANLKKILDAGEK
eukprot:NODE_11107_length_472_cov_18.280802_g10452_i0.p1 GENE.NODE_11107_length_472_cov_18.280802_g10452_i0~~NODE_11107_length_472_cov_18.280802_g10452_i0.p1  ORF type:complete len:130 (-),score=36.67 NODE_11107_length_472_cov_18.280802_g10452_i0:81-413(-)